VRSAGSANSTPSADVPRMPSASAASSGQPRTATSRPAISAATPAKASWASESWPVKPTRTTTERMRIAHWALALTAFTQSTGRAYQITQIAAVTVMTSAGQWIRPLPREGSRSLTWPRSGMCRPLIAR
jgi:hypothetical protein